MQQHSTQGRLTARPNPELKEVAPPRGKVPLGRGGRDGLLYVPQAHDGARPAPLVVALHGAGGSTANTLRWMQPAADEHGLIVLMPQSIGRSWDIFTGSFGPDVSLIDAALAAVFASYHVDPALIGIAGFSDGASYALSLGLTNGDLFSAVLAFSPGFVSPGELRGKPKVLISHGTEDRVLPIDPCSRRIVPSLAQTGYAVHYLEFDGGHTIPEPIAQFAFELFTGRASPSDTPDAPPPAHSERGLP